MKKYLVILNQSGGCDYSINCGTEVVQIYLNPECIEKDLLDWLIDNYGEDTIMSLYLIQLVPLENTEIMNVDLVSLKNQLIKKEEESEEYREYLRLRNKYG